MIETSPTLTRSASQERIQKWSRVIHTGCRVVIAVQGFWLLLFVIGLLVPGHFLAKAWATDHHPAQSIATMRLCILIGLFLAIPFVLLVWKGLVHLRRLVACYAQGTFFSTEVVEQYRSIGWVFVAYATLQVIEYILTSVLSTSEMFWILKPGPEFTFLSPLKSAIFGGLVIVLSWIMDEGRRLREDQELTI